MGGEPNQAYWRGIRPTDPPENIPVDIKVCGITLPVGIASVIGNLPVDIKAHTVNTPIIPSAPPQNIPVDVKAVTGNVPIIPSTPPQNIPVDVKAFTGNVPIVPASPEQVFTRYEPPEGTTFVRANATAVNGTTLLYTVPPSKVLYLTDFTFSLYPIGVNGYGSIQTYDTVPAMCFSLSVLTCIANLGDSVKGAFNIALQLPAGYTVYLMSSALNINAYGGITGYLRNV